MSASRIAGRVFAGEHIPAACRVLAWLDNVPIGETRLLFADFDKLVFPAQKSLVHLESIHGSGPPVLEPSVEVLRLILDYPGTQPTITKSNPES